MKNPFLHWVGAVRRAVACTWQGPFSSVRSRVTPVDYFHVDAFARWPFEGNPAGVCFLDEARSAEWMQRIASEMNLSETAFVCGKANGFDLRWFTSNAEVPLCGHATLASAHVLWETGRVSLGSEICFDTLSGTLTARHSNQLIQIDLPARPVRQEPAPDDVTQALDVSPEFIGRTTDCGLGAADYLVEVEDEVAVRSVQPDFRRLRHVPGGVIVTAPGASDAYDIVSRYFAPWWGVDEDPVTGSAHCALVPFWAERLGKEHLVAFQASQRGGTVHGRLVGERVLLSGGAVTVARGRLEL